MKARLLSTSSTLMLVWGCGGDPTPPSPPPQISIETPASVSIFSTPPGNTTSLPVTVKDARGVTIVSGFEKSFSSNNAAVATVSSDGTVKAVAGGTAQITTTVKSGSMTVTTTTAVSVTVPPMAGVVTAPAFTFSPGELHVSVGGTVTWTIGKVTHDVTFSTAGAPNSIPRLQNASDSRVFTRPGTFSYICTLHAGMTATVVVH